MQCPKCQFDNREGAKFCLKCGEKLEFKCPTCGKQLPSEAMFCDECGR
jgi:predicted amidophosphoribosyltransferase